MSIMKLLPQIKKNNNEKGKIKKGDKKMKRIFKKVYLHCLNVWETQNIDAEIVFDFAVHTFIEHGKVKVSWKC